MPMALSLQNHRLVSAINMPAVTGVKIIDAPRRAQSTDIKWLPIEMSTVSRFARGTKAALSL